MRGHKRGWCVTQDHSPAQRTPTPRPPLPRFEQRRGDVSPALSLPGERVHVTSKV